MKRVDLMPPLVPVDAEVILRLRSVDFARVIRYQLLLALFQKHWARSSEDRAVPRREDP